MPAGAAAWGGGGRSGLLVALQLGFQLGDVLLDQLQLGLQIGGGLLGHLQVVGGGVDLVVAGAGGLFQVVQPLLQGLELGIGLVGDAHLDRLAGVLGLQHDLAQLAQLLFEALEALLGGIDRFGVGPARGGRGKRDDAGCRRGPKNPGIHLTSFPLRRVQNAAKLEPWEEASGLTGRRP